MKVKNPLIYFFWFLVLVSTVDFIGAIFVQSGEANPLFVLSKSLLPVLGLKVLTLGIFGFYLYRNKYNSDFGYFLTLMVLILGIGITAVAAVGNIYAATHPIVLAVATTMTSAEKVSGYAWYVGMMYLLPLVLNMITFKIFQWTKRYAIIGKKEEIVGDVV
jgi:hypothetical protein